MIVPMNKLTVFGLLFQKDLLIKRLIKAGVVQLEPAVERFEGLDSLHSDTVARQLADWENNLAAVSDAIALLAPYDTRKKGLFPQKRVLTKQQNREMVTRREGIQKMADAVSNCQKRLGELKTEENRVHNAIEAFRPWTAYDIYLQVDGTRTVDVLTGTLPAQADFGKLLSDLQGQKCVVEQLGEDSKLRYLSVIRAKHGAEAAEALLREAGFARVDMTAYTQTVQDNIQKLRERLDGISREREELIMQLKSYAPHLEELEWLRDALRIDCDRKAVYEKAACTQSTVILYGYVPQPQAARVKDAIESSLRAVVVAEPVPDGEEFPVLLQNSKAVEPFEVVTELYSMPKASRGVDPNTVMAPFYFLFFGLMLSDAAYGLILSIAGFFILWRYKPEGMMKKLIGLLAICGISTFGWGILFGGWFGNVAEAVTNGKFILQPVWFNPLDNPMKLLIWSFVLGFLHIYAAMGMDIYTKWKNGAKADAIFDTVPWLLVLIGLPLAAAPMGASMMESAIPPSASGVLTKMGLVLAIVGVAALILTQGRKEKNMFKKLTKGISSLYDITGYVSDILSYSRLLALGLATGVIAMVVNTMGTLAGTDNAVGIILFVIVFILGHALNLSINVLGAFVHSSRLQYVEFFGKFYEGGGKAFRPFAQHTKYVTVQE